MDLTEGRATGIPSWRPRDKFWFKQPIVHTAAYVKIEDKSLREKVETLLIRFLKSNAVINKQNVECE